MISLVNENIEKLASICISNHVENLYLFGSAASSRFTGESDLDFAVVFSASLSPLEHGKAFFTLKEEIEKLFEREIDLISYRVIKNPIFKAELDKTKITLYAA
jgi:predicted nucleotidyltransferase